MRCLACGSNKLSLWAKVTDTEYFSTADCFSYNRCADCDALSIDPVPENRLTEIYPQNYYSFSSVNTSFFTNIKMKLDRSLFRSILRPITGCQLSVLDIGGGSGWLLTEACKVDSRISYTMVVDIDSKAESIARKAGHDYYCGPIEDFETFSRFDLILMLNLVEHVKDPVAVLSAVGRLLKPGGRILIKTPNYDSIDARIFRSSYWGGLHCPRHWILFTPLSFRRVADAAGLQTHEILLTQGGPFWAWSIMNQLHRMGLVKLSAERPMCYHPLTGILQAFFALFDFLRMRISSTSQMFVILSR